MSDKIEEAAQVERVIKSLRKGRKAMWELRLAAYINQTNCLVTQYEAEMEEVDAVLKAIPAVQPALHASVCLTEEEMSRVAESVNLAQGMVDVLCDRIKAVQPEAQVERVARILAETDNCEVWHGWDDYCEEDQTNFLAQARAAITAMPPQPVWSGSVPTEAGLYWWYWGDHGGERQIVPVWVVKDVAGVLRGLDLSDSGEGYIEMSEDEWGASKWMPIPTPGEQP